MPLGDEKRLGRRQRILASARERLGRVGCDNVTMKALADASGVTRPTLSNTFGTRDDLLYEMCPGQAISLVDEDGG